MTAAGAGFLAAAAFLVHGGPGTPLGLFLADAAILIDEPELATLIRNLTAEDVVQSDEMAAAPA